MQDSKEPQTPEISIDLDQLIDSSTGQKKSENDQMNFSVKKNDALNLSEISVEPSKMTKDFIDFGDSRESSNSEDLKVSYWKWVVLSF